MASPEALPSTVDDDVRTTDRIDDELWAAIGDPTRRRVLDLLLATGSGTASSLSRHLPVTRQAVTKHLTVLRRCGLVRTEPAGREVRYAVDPDQFARACAQVAQVSLAWDGRLRRIKDIAETLERQRAAADPRG